MTWLLAGLIGLALGLLGGGGSILTVPVFTYLLGYEPRQAIAMSLPVVGVAAFTGAVAALARRTLPLGPAVVMGPATMAGAYAGARVAQLIAGRTQLMLLAVIMLGASVAMWRRSRDTRLRAAAHPHPLLVAAIGVGVGLLTGLVGIGGGFLIVPALVIVGGLPMSQATGASLLVIAMSASAGLIGYLDHVTFDWHVVAVFAGVASVGVVAGGGLARHVPAERLQQAFAVLLVVIAGYMLARP